VKPGYRQKICGRDLCVTPDMSVSR
jgi:hypothetical protein